MSENTSALAEAPAAPSVPVTPQEAPAAPTGDKPTTTTDFDMMSAEQLEAVLEAANQPEALREKPEQIAEQQQPSPATPVAPPATPTGEEEDDGSRPLAKNFRFHTEDPKQREFLRMMKQQPTANPIDLARIAGYELPASAQPATPPATPEPPAPNVDPLAGHRQKVSELKEKLREAEKNYSPTAEILDELQDAKLELRDAEATHRENEATMQEFQAGRQTALQSAIQLSPESGQKGTTQYEEVRREIALLEKENSPILDNPDYPVVVLERLARRYPSLFPNVAKPTGSAPAPTTPAPAARPNGQVESSRNGAHTAIAPQDAARQIENMSMEQLEALANETGTKHRG